ncbi:MAG: hypothetical protein LBU86_01655 [Oscillospiraceae bacterium]|jgi:acyl-ACP thioesterase|nr:hypothetical protein [Oscillospiraceae bacterium]
MYFYKDMTAAYYDCDQSNELKPSGMLRYMQQTSSEQLRGLGQSPERLYHEKLVFLLSKFNLRIERYPGCGEEIRIGTAAVGLKGARFAREFVIETKNGERLVSGYSLWVLTDTGEHRILRPKEYPHQFPFEAPGLAGIVDDIPIPRDKDLAPGLLREIIEIPVRYSHIDVNLHVNNAMYADFVCDALPFSELCKKRLGTLAIHFAGEARHGDVIRVETARLGEGVFRIAGTHGRGLCFEAVAAYGRSSH